MPGTAEGARKARQTITKRYGDDFYAKIGAKGGAASKTGGFAANKKLAREAGKKGGAISKRGPSKNHLPRVVLAHEDCLFCQDLLSKRRKTLLERFRR